MPGKSPPTCTFTVIVSLLISYRNSKVPSMSSWIEEFLGLNGEINEQYADIKFDRYLSGPES